MVIGHAGSGAEALSAKVPGERMWYPPAAPFPARLPVFERHKKGKDRGRS